MMQSMKAVLVDYDDDLFDISPAALRYMRETLATAGATLHVAQCRTEESTLRLAADADLVMIQSVRPLLNARVIPQLARCRGIIRLGLGYDSVDLVAATAAGIPVSNVVDWCTDEVAEHAIALLFACARHLAPLHETVSDGGWDRTRARGIHRLRGQTLGIVGFGRIGRAVGQRMSAFGVKVLAYDPWLDAEAIARAGAEKAELHDLLRRADLISLHTPLTPETHHLIGHREFALMKEGAIIVNTSRGPVMDEAALAEALWSGRLGGAGLDVMEREPLPADSPLRGMPNVTFTTHVASYSAEAVETLYRFGADIAAEMLAGRWVRTIINPEVKERLAARWAQPGVSAKTRRNGW